MSNYIRKCRLANSKHRDVNLLDYQEIIINTINQTVPGKNPQVYSDHFSTDELTHSESVALGRALSKIDGLNKLGKKITIFRLFDGCTCKADDTNIRQSSNKPKGGRLK